MEHIKVIMGRRSGFTLIELLVVSGIIAIMIGILLPVLSRVRQSARTTACANHQRQMAMGALSRAATNGGYLPLSGWVTLPPNASSFDSLPALLNDPKHIRYAYGPPSSFFPGGTAPLPPHAAIGEHLELLSSGLFEVPVNPEPVELFSCPDADTPTTILEMIGLRSGESDYIHQLGLPTDYAWNSGLTGFHHDRAYNHARRRGALSQMADSSRMVLFGDTDSFKSDAGLLHWAPSLALRADESVTLADAFDRSAKMEESAYFASMRHGGVMNVAFADGHVTAMSIDSETLADALLLDAR